jgi:NhaB family Na+:H+ antiporter
MALQCYPLQPGGLLALQAAPPGLVSTGSGLHGSSARLSGHSRCSVFMVAGIHFLRDGLLFLFSGLLLRVRSQTALALVFCASGAFLSAFLDALTVLAVIISVAVGCHGLYHRVASAGKLDLDHDPRTGDDVVEFHHEDLDRFRAFLRSLLMHAAVGTTLGGVCTMVGEPQNLLIAKAAGWDFAEFFHEMSPVTMPVLAIGLLTCVVVQHFRLFGYGEPMPEKARAVLEDHARTQAAARTDSDRLRLWVQGTVAVLLVLALAFHVAEVGLVGLLVIVLATAFCGVTDEHRLGEAFTSALPFTALLVVFFAIVGAINQQDLFGPMVHWVLTLEGKQQAAAFVSGQWRAFVHQRQRVRGEHLYRGTAAPVHAGRADARAVRLAGGGGEYRHQHPVHRHTERAGGVPVPAHLVRGAAGAAGLWPHVLDGAAVPRAPWRPWGSSRWCIGGRVASTLSPPRKWYV